MKVDFDAPILTLEGEPIKDGQDTLTLSSVACNALLAVLQSDNALKGADKMRMFRLAQIASKGGVQEATNEEIVLLKDRVGTMYGALIVGRVFDLLEGPQPAAPPTKRPAVVK